MLGALSSRRAMTRVMYCGLIVTNGERHVYRWWNTRHVARPRPDHLRPAQGLNAGSPEPADGQASSDDQAPIAEHIAHNIESILAFHEREHEKVGPAQRRIEAASRVISRPLYLIVLLVLVLGWMAGNELALRLGARPLDAPPFAWLQGAVALAALITSTVVLYAQSRQAKLETQRAHLDLQVNLLTEQKVTKLIVLLEELRRDLPNVHDRVDTEAGILQQRTDAAQVLSALDQGPREAG
jgi:uncharacterized membrane protein